jgi:putative transcriptional regulator
VRKAQKKSAFGRQFIESAKEAVQIERGEREAARITKYTAAEAEVEPPPRYVSERIKEIREQMGLSQPVFAAALNVSTETVRAWEQGKREPDGATLRLLEVAEEHPDILLKNVQARRRGSRTLAPA